MYCLQARPSIFQPGNFTGWDGQGVNVHRNPLRFIRDREVEGGGGRGKGGGG